MFSLTAGWLCLATGLLGGGVAAAQDPSSVDLSLLKGLRLNDPDHHTSVQVGYLGWLRFEDVIAADASRQAFSMPLARPSLTVSTLDKALRFTLQTELSGTPKLLDAEVVGMFRPDMGLHVGQYRPYFSRGWRTGLPFLALPGRGIVQDAFHPARELGVTLLGTPAKGKVEYYLGVFNGDVATGAVQEHPHMATARLVLNPLGPTPYTQVPWSAGVDGQRVSIGLNGMWNAPLTLDADGVQHAQTDLTGAVDLTWLNPRWAWSTEGFFRQSTDEADTATATWGAYTQLSHLLRAEGNVDLSGRVGVLKTATTGDEPGRTVEVGAGWYPYKDHLKLQLYGQAQDALQTDHSLTYVVGTQAQIWL